MKLIELFIVKIYFDGFGLILIGAVLLCLLVFWIDSKIQEFKKRRSERKVKKNETD